MSNNNISLASGYQIVPLREQRKPKHSGVSVKRQPFELEEHLAEGPFFLPARAAEAIGPAVTATMVIDWANKNETPFGMSMKVVTAGGKNPLDIYHSYKTKCIPASVVYELKELLPNRETLDDLVGQHETEKLLGKKVPLIDRETAKRQYLNAKNFAELLKEFRTTATTVQNWMKRGSAHYIDFDIVTCGREMMVPKAQAIQVEKRMAARSRFLSEENSRRKLIPSG